MFKMKVNGVGATTFLSKFVKYFIFGSLTVDIFWFGYYIWKSMQAKITFWSKQKSKIHEGY